MTKVIKDSRVVHSEVFTGTMVIALALLSGNSFLLLFFFLGFDILSPSSNIKTSALFYKNISCFSP